MKLEQSFLNVNSHCLTAYRMLKLAYNLPFLKFLSKQKIKLEVRGKECLFLGSSGWFLFDSAATYIKLFRIG